MMLLAQPRLGCRLHSQWGNLMLVGLMLVVFVEMVVMVPSMAAGQQAATTTARATQVVQMDPDCQVLIAVYGDRDCGAGGMQVTRHQLLPDGGGKDAADVLQHGGYGLRLHETDTTALGWRETGAGHTTARGPQDKIKLRAVPRPSNGGGGSDGNGDGDADEDDRGGNEGGLSTLSGCCSLTSGCNAIEVRGAASATYYLRVNCSLLSVALMGNSQCQGPPTIVWGGGPLTCGSLAPTRSFLSVFVRYPVNKTEPTPLSPDDDDFFDEPYFKPGLVCQTSMGNCVSGASSRGSTFALEAMRPLLGALHRWWAVTRALADALLLPWNM